MSKSETMSHTDGRHQRSERSRDLIIGALLELVQAGQMNPSAADIARSAKVSLRTVYRLFEDAETLHQTLAEQIEKAFMPRVLAPLNATDWTSRLFELVERRVGVYEDLLMVRAAASSRRFISADLMEYHRRFVEIERRALDRALSEGHAPAPVDWREIDIFLNFETWRRLRHDLDLSPDAAKASLSRMLKTYLVGADA